MEGCMIHIVTQVLKILFKNWKSLEILESLLTISLWKKKIVTLKFKVALNKKFKKLRKKGTFLNTQL